MKTRGRRLEKPNFYKVVGEQRRLGYLRASFNLSVLRPSVIYPITLSGSARDAGVLGLTCQRSILF